MFAVFGEESRYTLFIGTIPVLVTVADDPESRARGLGGVQSLGENEGKFFVFDEAKKHGIWMKDMVIPIDILWIDDNLSVVHIEKEVQPNTFPTVFAPPVEARFVLETNSFFVEAMKINIGDRVFVPPEILPSDIIHSLQ
jgi:uncharacterized membrane protein (UPF0127 family)